MAHGIVNRSIVASCIGKIDSRFSIHESRCLRLLFATLLLERVLDLLDNPFECHLIRDREIGQNLAIEPDTGGFKAFSETAVGRSEERRVGKECRSRWSPYH